MQHSLVKLASYIYKKKLLLIFFMGEEAGMELIMGISLILVYF